MARVAMCTVKRNGSSICTRNKNKHTNKRKYYFLLTLEGTSIREKFLLCHCAKPNVN